MFPKTVIVSVMLIIYAAYLCERNKYKAYALSTFSGAAADFKTLDDYRNSLLKQEKEFLQMRGDVRGTCESVSCSVQTVKLTSAIQTKGKSEMKISTDYQDCMLACIRKRKRLLLKYEINLLRYKRCAQLSQLLNDGELKINTTAWRCKLRTSLAQKRNTQPLYLKVQKSLMRNVKATEQAITTVAESSGSIQVNYLN
ncbi:hypothetical protein D918_03059 [Trichuris suis]|nr:hypothetical protein D918_03059 [Trichuris suis]